MLVAKVFSNYGLILICGDYSVNKERILTL